MLVSSHTERHAPPFLTLVAVFSFLQNLHYCGGICPCPIQVEAPAVAIREWCLDQVLVRELHR